MLFAVVVVVVFVVVAVAVAVAVVAFKHVINKNDDEIKDASLKYYFC